MSVWQTSINCYFPMYVHRMIRRICSTTKACSVAENVFQTHLPVDFFFSFAFVCYDLRLSKSVERRSAAAEADKILIYRRIAVSVAAAT